MKKIILLFLLITSLGYAQQQTVTYIVSPATFEETDLVTLTFNGNSINEASWGVVGNALYLWAWSFDINDVNIIDCPTNGGWTNSNELNRLIYNSGNDTYSISFTPTIFYNRVGMGRIGFLIKAKNGTGDKKSQDIRVEVGNFQVTLTSPLENSSTILSSGGSLSIAATNTAGNASYNLKANGVSINTNPSASSYAFNHTTISSNQNYDLEVTQGAITITKKFAAIVNPGTVSETIPTGLVDGINYNSADPTKATLVLDALGKDFIYVAGSFNNWQPSTTFAMKKDATAGSTKFWLELSGLVSGTNFTYQYWVVDQTPVANSPVLVKTADPYSTLVLSKEDDPWIPAGNYPNLPAYPVGQDREVTVLQTGQTPYVWSAATTNFVKPEKDKLVVYEALVRDFDANRSYQNLIDRIDYFKNLKVNAIELMPVMEFEGNESWGYNTSFHMALDKAYGNSGKFKEFIDLCHQNGIAVILDVALNHAFGRNPMDRMWMSDPDGDGWGGPASDNPYFNISSTHSYNVGNDFNHQLPRTKNYVKRVVKHWIEEYKIDGFRWDLTKGFTQNCPFTGNGSAQDNCTNVYQQDRVDVLKDYADYSWSLDPNHIVIFEHLGNDNEEQQWANYRLGETPRKGVLMWGKMTNEYNQLSMGYNSSNNIERMGHDAHGFAGKRVIGYAESHDEEILMYKNLTFGQSANPTHNVKNLNTALSRMSAIGAVSLLVPGPKMIWQFGDLGWNNSIWTCNNGVVNSDYDGGVPPGDCKLDKKPQPQWVNNWLGDVNRNKIYFDWAKMINLKTTEPVFNANFDIQSGNTFTPRLFIWDDTMPSTLLKNVVVLTNFDVNTQNVVPNFPYTGTWYNLMDNSTFEVTSTTATIAIEAGGFRVYGNKASALGTDTFEVNGEIYLYPNPTTNYFTLNITVSKVEIYSITGQLVKSFNANQSQENQFPISDLNQGMYIVKTLNENKQIKEMKLLKQ